MSLQVNSSDSLERLINVTAIQADEPQQYHAKFMMENLFGSSTSDQTLTLPHQEQAEALDQLINRVDQALKHATSRSQINPLSSLITDIQKLYTDLTQQLAQDRSPASDALNFTISQSFEHIVAAYAQKKASIECREIYRGRL